MSEMAPEGGVPGQAGGNFFTRKYMGIPGIVWLAGAAILAYFLLRGKTGTSGATSTAGSGTSTTGNITLQPGTTTIKAQYGPNSSASTSGASHGTHNPQPHPSPRPPVKHHHTQVKTPAREQFVTAGQWPGASSGGHAAWNTTLWGIGQHEHVSLAELLKLNPHIKNPNLIYPGQRIRYRLWLRV
jgi:LysM repeat protein